MTVLLLAGTAEARLLAALLAKAGITALASFSGATRHPLPLAIVHRTGGFGGKAAQADFMKRQGIRAVIDATHPFSVQITQRTALLSAELGLPYLNLVRPPWQPEPLDKWIEIASAKAAQGYIPIGARVFLATGRQTLPEYKNLTGRTLICRVIDPPQGEFPFPGGAFVIGQPPFRIADEVALFEKHRIEWLIVKNSGGALGLAKLEAARAMTIPVLMIARPKPVGGDIATDAHNAMAWLDQQLN